MSWDKVKKLVGQSAPLLGTLIGGPAGATVGALLSTALGVENTPKSIEEAIKNDPSALIKLKELELTHKVELENLAFKTLDVELADKQDARLRHGHSIMPAVLVIVLSLMVLLAGIAIFYSAIPEENRSLGNLIFGALLAKWGDSIAYWVGTTRSSANKDLMKNK
jgi:hypothetical protein